MKKLLSSFILLSIVNLSGLTYTNAQGLGGSGEMPRATPENIMCPDGKIRSHCVEHEWRGCSDDLGC